MQHIINASEVRKDFSSFIDDVVIRNIPKIVKRNNRDCFFSISIDQQRLILSNYKFSAKIEVEKDGSYTVSLDQLDIVVNEKTKEKAIHSLAEELIEYAKEYIDNIQLYYNAPNRRSHLGYVLNVLLQESIEDVKNLIHA